MDNLSDLAAVLRALEADKITDRKRAAEKLRHLLSKPQVGRALTYHGEERQHGIKGRLIWDNVLKAVIRYVHTETELLQRAKENVSTASQATRDRKKQDISAVFKFVIRTVIKYCGHVKTSILLSHILEVMKEDFTCQAFGTDYSSVLLKNILSIRKHWIEISQKTWHELLILYCQLFLDARCVVDRVIVARLVHVMMKGASRQCDLQPKKLLVFFAEIFKKIKELKSMDVLEHLVGAMNVFVKAIAHNNRVQICKLGESIMPGLLYLWENYPSDVLKDKIDVQNAYNISINNFPLETNLFNHMENMVEFLQLQLQAHHPGGARTSDTGAFSVDWNVWKNHIKKLYRVVLTEIDQLGGRQKFASGSRNVVMKDSYIELAADICHKIFSEDCKSIEVMQLPATTQEGDGMPNKKRRIMSVWSMMLDSIMNKANTPQMIPWLQILGCVLEKYPDSLQEMDGAAVLQALQQVLISCKGSEMYKHIFSCLTALSKGMRQQDLQQIRRNDMSHFWLQVWSSSLSIISSRQAETDGYQQYGFELLATMLQCHKVSPSRQVWNLFLPDVTHPTPSSLTFLTSLLASSSLPENYKPSILNSGFVAEKGAFPLRKHLLSWVLSALTSSGSSLKEWSKMSGENVAQILLQLILRDPGQLFKKRVAEKDFMTSLQKVYLQTTFDTELDFENSKSEMTVAKIETCHIIPVLVTHLKETLQTLIHQHLELAAEWQTGMLDLLAFDCSILSHCLKNIQQHGIPLEGIEILLKQVMNRLTSMINDHSKKAGTAGLMPVIQSLQTMVTFKETEGLASYLTAEIVRGCVPARLIELLQDCTTKKLVRSAYADKSSSRTGTGCLPLFHTANTSQAEDDLDDVGIAENEDMDVNFDHVSDEEDNQIGEKGQELQSAACSSLWEQQSFSESQILRNGILQFLGLLTGFDRGSASQSVHPSFDIAATKNRLVDIFYEDIFDQAQPADVQMMQQVFETLLSADHHVTDKELESIMDVLRRLVRAQRQDQEICCLILSLLARVCPHLMHTDDLPSQTCLDCREMLLQLVSAFWRLQSEGHYNSHVRLSLAKCMGVISKCDPQGNWGTLKLTRQDEEESAKLTVATKFPHCLIDSSLVVRLYMASNISQLFIREVRGKQIPVEKMHQHQTFCLVYEVCNDMMDIQGRLSAERQQDERSNRVASLLLALSTVAMTSPLCEKQALFALCQVIQEKNVDISLVSKVMQKMSLACGYEAASSYLSCHMPFLVSQWLDLEYPLNRFPFKLLKCDSSQQFYRVHVKVLVPQLFMRNDFKTLDDLAEILQLPLNEVLHECLPVILVHILPVFAVSKQSSGSTSGLKRHLTNATVCYDSLVTKLGKETIDRSIVNQLGNIVVNLLSCLKLQRERCLPEGNCDPEPNPPSYDEDTVRATLAYLTHSFSGNPRSIVAVLARTADGLEQVLLELCLIMWREQRVHERLRCLQMFQLFVTMMLQELATTQLGGAWAFVLRRVIATLLQMLKPQEMVDGQGYGYEEDITVVSLNLLKQVCTAIIECCLKEFEKYLGNIVDVVSQLALYCGKIGETAMDLLNFLLIENADVIHTSIASMDPLPQDSVFVRLANHCERIRDKTGCKSHQKLIEQVIRVSRDAVKPAHSFARMLCLLSNAIDSNRAQFLLLMADCQGSALIRQLLCELLKLTQSPVKVVAEEAGHCLGAIGPVNLKTVSLPRPLPSLGLGLALTIYMGSPFEKYCHVFHYLNQYLIDPSVEVVQMASATLKQLMATSAGLRFSTDYKEKLVNKDFLFQYLHPFRSSRNSKTPPSSGAGLNLEQCHDQCNRLEIWEAEHTDHTRWVTDLCLTLLQSGAILDPILTLLQPVCQMKVQFSEMILPYLVHEILLAGQTELSEILSQRIAGFFHTHCHFMSSNRARTAEDDLLKSVCINNESVLVILKVINYLRTQDRPAERSDKVMTAWDNNFWLDLNYLEVAWAAQNCSAHFSAILFAEIWWDVQRESEQKHLSPNLPQQSSSQSSSLLSQSSSDDLTSVQSLLLEAMRCIGDPDAVYGCGAGSKPDAASRVETYLHEKEWEKALVTLDIQMQEPSPLTQLQLFKALKNCGGEYVVSTCLQGLRDNSQPDLTELQYQAAWKAGQWDLDVPPMKGRTISLHQSLYSCLYAVKDGQPSRAQSILNNFRWSLLQTFDVNVENCQSLYPLLSQLQCLRQFELLINALVSEKKTETLNSLLTSWQQEEVSLDGAEFEFLEQVYCLRIAAVRLLVDSESHPEAQTALQGILLHTIKTARDAGYYQLAERYLHKLQLQTQMSLITSLHTQLQMAQLFWARSEQLTAKHVLKSLINQCHQVGKENREVMCLLTQSLALYGNWLAETRSETPTVIMEQYLEKAVQLLENREDSTGPEAVECYLSLARFSDTQYQNIVDYMKSPTFEAKQALMNKAAAEYEKYTEGGEQLQKDRYLRTLEKQSKIDKQEVAGLIGDRKRFLHHAVHCYASCLYQGDTHDLRIFRLTSLWFDNSASSEVNQILKEYSQKLKSYKFLPLMHQLAARMSTKVKENQLFLPILEKILERVAVDHPHHSLWVLLALANAKKDEEAVLQGLSAKRRGKLAIGRNISLETEDRVEAAQKLLEGLKTRTKIGNIVRDMELLSAAYIELANWSAEQYRRESKSISLPKTLKLTTLKDLSKVAVPSLELKVDPACSYDNVVSVVGYQPTFRLAGGVNLPKIVTCRCSDGVDRRQLVKGRDDLRQDAIMQQVFSLVNRLLSCDPATNRRQLNIRTYKVVPLSRRSGLLEWCEGTQPIGEYLVGQTGTKGAGAHSHYRPKDWCYLDCRKHMQSVSNVSNAEKKYKVYMEVCQNFQPVFRFFFMEKYPEPAEWFQRRLSYTHSVATNSIVGYILGLGDRHVMNILIDCRSAELIHIDLGIAFEQGHILPTPETVPFRLTRDIVDGMGITGVEGVFRRCCEKTMEVMRAHKESLMTIVQVLLYDPLSEWTLSPQRAYELQVRHDRRDCDTTDLNVSLAGSGDTELDVDGDKSAEREEPVNKLAERVLLRLQQKLQGIEEGVALIVAGQVNHLIQTARDPHNLSKLFAGWQPYI